MAARASSAERARRMMALLPLLTPGADLPLASLASIVGATPAQVAADVTLLSMCGLPPYSPDELVDAFVDGEVVRVFAAPPALDRPLRLTPAEAAALAAALETCGRDGDDPLTAKLLAAASAPSDAEELASALRAAVAPGGLADIHAVLAGALHEHQAVRIEYFSAGRGEVTERVIEPWAMGVDRGAWYVTAWCRNAGGERVFRLDRIHTVEPVGERFTPPERVAPPVPAFPAEGDLHHAVVRFAGSDLSSRDLPGALFRPGDGDDTVADVPFAAPAWLARRVVGRLGDAEVLSPDEVRAEVVAVAQRELAELGDAPGGDAR
jgi:proteasome accessory factor C